MIEEKTCEEAATKPQIKTKAKRDIVRFNGEPPFAINLEKVNAIFLEGKKIKFSFISNETCFDMDNDEAAKNAYESILNLWVSEYVVE